jgi:hypothetical protein
MEYTLVEAESAEELRRKVLALVEEGWEPQGGVSVATHGVGSWWYFQAMVRHPEV